MLQKLLAGRSRLADPYYLYSCEVNNRVYFTKAWVSELSLGRWYSFSGSFGMFSQYMQQVNQQWSIVNIQEKLLLLRNRWITVKTAGQFPHEQNCCVRVRSRKKCFLFDFEALVEFFKHSRLSSFSSISIYKSSWFYDAVSFTSWISIDVAFGLPVSISPTFPKASCSSRDGQRIFGSNFWKANSNDGG